MSDGADELIRTQADGVVTLTINRPEVRNALSRKLLGRLTAALGEADGDPAVRTVVLAATGSEAFCAGMDLREFAAGSPETGVDAGAGAFATFLRHGIRKPLVGAAVGTAVGGGLELLLACDIVIASDAAWFGLTEVTRGLVPGGIGILLGRRIPLGRALELTLTGDRLPAAEALRLGLVNRVVPPDQVLPEAIALARRIAANAPLAVVAAKELVRSAADAPLEETWRRQDVLRPTVFGSDDAREGAAAFLERRAPNWKGI